MVVFEIENGGVGECCGEGRIVCMRRVEKYRKKKERTMSLSSGRLCICTYECITPRVVMRGIILYQYYTYYV